MSKYDEICQAIQSGIDHYSAYHKESHEFAKRLMSQYILFLEIPVGKYEYVPLNKDPEPNTKYNISGSMYLDNDSFWHLGFRIFFKPNTPVLLHFMFKKEEDGKFAIKLANHDGSKYRISEDSDFLQFFEFLHDNLEAYFQNFVNEFLYKSDPENPFQTIGFKPY